MTIQVSISVKLLVALKERHAAGDSLSHVAWPHWWRQKSWREILWDLLSAPLIQEAIRIPPVKQCLSKGNFNQNWLYSWNHHLRHNWRTELSAIASSLLGFFCLVFLLCVLALVSDHLLHCSVVRWQRLAFHFIRISDPSSGVVPTSEIVCEGEDVNK